MYFECWQYILDCIAKASWHGDMQDAQGYEATTIRVHKQYAVSAAMNKILL